MAEGKFIHIQIPSIIAQTRLFDKFVGTHGWYHMQKIKTPGYPLLSIGNILKNGSIVIPNFHQIVLKFGSNTVASGYIL